MKKSPYPHLILSAALLASILLAGCVTYIGYGSIKTAERGTTIQGLVENWQDYHVYYSGLYVNRPSGLMFDPKYDERQLVSNRWRPVRDRETLDEILMWLENNPTYRPRLLRILGPDQVVYGYVYTGWHHVVARAVEPRVMRVLDLPTPLPDDPDVPSR